MNAIPVKSCTACFRRRWGVNWWRISTISNLRFAGNVVLLHESADDWEMVHNLLEECAMLKKEWRGAKKCLALWWWCVTLSSGCCAYRRCGTVLRVNCAVSEWTLDLVANTYFWPLSWLHMVLVVHRADYNPVKRQLFRQWNAFNCQLTFSASNMLYIGPCSVEACSTLLWRLLHWSASSRVAECWGVRCAWEVRGRHRHTQQVST